MWNVHKTKSQCNKNFALQIFLGKYSGMKKKTFVGSTLKKNFVKWIVVKSSKEFLSAATPGQKQQSSRIQKFLASQQ